MATDIAEVLSHCGFAAPHRIVRRGNEPDLLDHSGESGLDASVACVARVLTWWATGVDDISELPKTGTEDDHVDAVLSCIEVREPGDRPDPWRSLATMLTLSPPDDIRCVRCGERTRFGDAWSHWETSHRGVVATAGCDGPSRQSVTEEQP